MSGTCNVAHKGRHGYTRARAPARWCASVKDVPGILNISTTFESDHSVTLFRNTLFKNSRLSIFFIISDRFCSKTLYSSKSAYSTVDKLEIYHQRVYKIVLVHLMANISQGFSITVVVHTLIVVKLWIRMVMQRIRFNFYPQDALPWGCLGRK